MVLIYMYMCWNWICSSECKTGYFGVNCSMSCPPNFYGLGCQLRCNCLDDECDFVLGCAGDNGKYQQRVFA